ncbi:MAG: alkane 1-monooxygenase [Proteobacteria bacterium]|nr:alkane 1-monooxygenase [Pseudomonadota bacterium]MBS0572168.1 alkane 1-monooxygenase [Pseudomonadota bacterium]
MSSSPSRPVPALPFLLSFAMLPLLWFGATRGGWTLILPPLYGYVVLTLLDGVLGQNRDDPPADLPDSALLRHRLITLVWLPLELCAIYGAIWWATRAGGLGMAERIGLFFGVGMTSGAVGIVYAHELMHQKNRAERWLGDMLMALVLYSHFRSEHLLVHHRHVGTVRDAVTARYNEGFHRFFPRVLLAGPGSAWRAERQLLARAGRGMGHRSNPFWRYGLLQAAALIAAWATGGWQGVGLFAFQALVAVWHLELTNYVEHYGLTREYLGDGRYEPVGPQHSWNADHRATNWFLINLQRHSDHHIRPDRRYPLLRTHAEDRAPQLPFGYPAMTALAMIPPLWRRRMNPRVRAWRRQFYPAITDWTDYNRGRLPMPRGAS